MNAHIEHDLLASGEAEVRRSFLSGAGRLLDDHVGSVAHLVSAWNIDKARDLAWVSVDAIWAIRRLELLVDRYTAALAGTVGMVSRYLLTPVAGAR